MAHYFWILMHVLTLSQISGRDLPAGNYTEYIESRTLESKKTVLQISSRVTRATRSNFTTLARSIGIEAFEYEVSTADGYILTLFHVRGRSRRPRPVLVMHGFAQCADDLILRGRTSPVYLLAEAGYDVWLGNARGTRYSRKHDRYSPDLDKEYWDFSFDEMGYYDMPAVIDFILETHNIRKLSVVGFSQGNLIFYILGSTRPEYNEKINVLVALAPISYMQHCKGWYSLLTELAPIIERAAGALGIVDFFDDRGVVRRFIDYLCVIDKVGYDICGKILLFALSGLEEYQIDSDFFTKTLVRYLPSSISLRDMFHYLQLSRRKTLAMYNYGPVRNLQVYDSTTPPEYNISKVSMRVALFQAQNDYLSRVEDTEMLRKQLPNVVYYELIKQAWTHLDFVYGENLESYIFKPVINILNTF